MDKVFNSMRYSEDWANEIKDSKYGFPYPWANAIAVGIFKK